MYGTRPSHLFSAVNSHGYDTTTIKMWLVEFFSFDTTLCNDDISKLCMRTARQINDGDVWLVKVVFKGEGGGVVYIFYTAQVDDNEMEIRHASVSKIDVMDF